MDDENGGTGDVGRMVYQTGWLPSLFRIRMRIRLTYSCTGTTLPYPSYSLFAFSPDVRAVYVRASAFGRRKRIGRGGFGEERGDGRARGDADEEEKEREYAYQPGTVYKVDRGIIMFARLSNALAFQIDSSGH